MKCMTESWTYTKRSKPCINGTAGPSRNQGELRHPLKEEWLAWPRNVGKLSSQESLREALDEHCEEAMSWEQYAQQMKIGLEGSLDNACSFARPAVSLYISDDFLNAFDPFPNCRSVMQLQQLAVPDRASKGIAALQISAHGVKDTVSFPLLCIPQRCNSPSMDLRHVVQQTDHCQGRLFGKLQGGGKQLLRESSQTDWGNRARG